jgi:hypothetical protein
MSDLEFAEDDVRAPGRPMPHRDLGPPTGIGRRIVLPSTGIPWPDPFRFKGSVGLGGDNFRDDVIRAQVLLGNSGDYDLAALGAPTGWPGGELWRGIRKYQKRKGLSVDGILQPVGADGVGEDGVGETVSALRDDLGTAFDGRRVPTPEEVDRHYDGPVRSDGGKEHAAPLLEIALREESGALPHYPLGTVSDADYPSQPEWRDGAQVAQLAPPYSPPLRPVAPPGTTGLTAQSPFPHEQPEVKAAGRQLQRLFDNAGVNATRWYEAGQAAWAEGQSRDPRLSDADQAAFTHMPGDIPAPPSRPVSEADQAAAKTPPLVPPKVDDKLGGRPAEEQQAYVEKLIPPEMQEWVEGLEPFDQELARELLIVFNKKTGGRRGDEATRTGNAELVKAIMDDLQQHRPEIGAYAKHTRGARRPDKSSELGYVEVPEEYIEGRDSGGPVGATWPDFTIKYTRQLPSGIVEEYLRGFTGQPLKSDPTTGVKSERDQIARSEYNWPGQLNEFAPKLRPDQAQGQVSTEKLEQYRQTARELAERLGLQWEQHLKDKGSL